MIKYFIEAPDGRWVTDPELWYEGKAAFTVHPFEAWEFDYNIVDADGKWGVFHTLTEIQKSGLLKNCLITEHEYIDTDKGKTIKHQVLDRRKHKFPGGAEYYLSMYSENRSVTDNSIYYG